MAKKAGALKNRLNKSYQDKDKGGVGQSAFDWKKVEGEVKFYKMKAGKHSINIVPYIIKSKNHPLVRSGDAKVGEQDYLLDVFVHRSVGPAQTGIICPKRNFGKACPICVQADEYKSKGQVKEAGQLRAQRLALYNVIDANDPDSGLMVFQVSHNLFEKELIEEARESSDNGDIIDFPDIYEGKVIKFRASEATFDGHQYFEFKNFAFADRDEKLDEDLIQQAISFDDCMKMYSAEEIEKILYGEDEPEGEGDEDEEKPVPTSKKAKKQVDEDEDEDEEEGEDEDEDEEEGEDEDDEPPAKPSKPVKPAKAEKGKKEASKDNRCPSGHEYGTDCDAFEDDCDGCKSWNDCLKEQQKLKKKGK